MPRAAAQLYVLTVEKITDKETKGGNYHGNNQSHIRKF